MVLFSDTEATKAVEDFDIDNHKFQVPQKDSTLAGPDGIPAWEKSQVQKLIELCLEKTCFLHLCENKGTDQLRSNRAADQRLCFCYI